MNLTYIIGGIVATVATVLGLRAAKAAGAPAPDPSFDALLASIPDGISATRLGNLHPTVARQAAQLLLDAEKRGIRLRVIEGYRTWEKQQEYFDRGRKTPGNIITNAPPGRSWHNWGLAFDVVEIKNGAALWENDRWPVIGAMGEALGLSWGGRWKSLVDRPHFENRMGFTIDQLLQRYPSPSAAPWIIM